jgi:hypothetical protein
MGRWSILDIDQACTISAQSPSEKRSPQQTSGAARSVSRATRNESVGGRSIPPARTRDTTIPRSEDRRTLHEGRGRTYTLRESEIQAMSDIGRFRTVDAHDLARFAYQSDERRMNQDIRNLRTQGLLEEKNLFRAHRQPRRILALTAEGHGVVERNAGLPSDQRIYHGFVKVRDTDHDADLYKVFQQAIQEIRNEGGRPIRVRLDFELRGAINRNREAAGPLTEDQRAKWLKAVAKYHGLPIAGSTIHVPDIQVEYETPEREMARANLELVSENYRGEAIRAKAESGFRVYARTGDANRVRRALQNPGAVTEIRSP